MAFRRVLLLRLNPAVTQGIPTLIQLSAVILAAGESSRMGRDKAWVELDGRALLPRAVATVRAAGIGEIFVSGREDGDYSGLDCPVLHDARPGCGPLAGIVEGLRAAGNPLLLVLAVDLPGMTSAFLRKLAARCDARTGAVPELSDRLEPLAAIYPRRCQVIAADLLRKGRRAARAFAEACRRERAIRAFSVPASDAACFVNCNTPADLAAARARLRRRPNVKDG